ncbi:MAG: hypothetical protein PVG64_02220 [Syntrophobacterales bacterium]|jgi:hypothetical protein
MMEREYTLVEIIRDPRILVCEASELTKDGHYYLYRYDGLEGKFYRATVPSGAAAVKFRNLEATDKIPLGGWQVVEKNQISKRDLYLVTQEEKQSGRTGA